MKQLWRWILRACGGRLEEGPPVEYSRYVSFERIADYIALGWAPDGVMPGHHGVYGVMMSWRGEGAPVEPEAQRPLATGEYIPRASGFPPGEPPHQGSGGRR